MRRFAAAEAQNQWRLGMVDCGPRVARDGPIPTACTAVQRAGAPNIIIIMMLSQFSRICVGALAPVQSFQHV